MKYDGDKMTKLNESAMAYEPRQTKNISELEKIPLDADIVEETYKDKKGDEFSVLIVEIDGEKYRVPQSVLNGIKGILTKFPDTKYVSVIKQGLGLATTYQVIPFNS